MVIEGHGFGSRERPAGFGIVVELSGEMDILAATELSGRLDEITGGRHPDVVLDVRAVTFMDCGGLSLLCRARHRAESRGGSLRLAGVAASRSVRRLLGLTGLARYFVIDEAAGLAGPLPGAAEEFPARGDAFPGLGDAYPGIGGDGDDGAAAGAAIA
ncbi:STAS domain-containing protein [Streptomyces sp. NPDC003077]|uniref:STAS domain-containing protein n=1 Tax=Streptomyces sp. NPDC003077 TaxID=3154443 RepID=UPI0033BC2B72